ncbi:MAG: class B sortase [Clostridia bacterium]|nr:class B sortase [Clostridia bacterium]
MARDYTDYSRAEKGSKKKSKLPIVIIILSLIVIVACCFYIGSTFLNEHAAKVSYGEIAVESEKTNDEGGTTSPVDLESLHKINSDVYAWIRIPGTHVDYPIAQSTVSDNYYLHRSIYKRYLFAGMIYTQSCNRTDFRDPVTVVYGHNMRSTTMFSTLHYFEDPSFFNEHDTFYIYTLDRVLTYKIVSAYRYDSRHIMNSFDFTEPEVLENFQQHTLNPLSTLRNVRSGVTLDKDSKLVVLSTCMSNDKSSRYLVNGVLISDVPIS